MIGKKAVVFLMLSFVFASTFVGLSQVDHAKVVSMQINVK